MLNYNKTQLLLDFELPSGNLFSGPLNILNVPRCGAAPAQGVIVRETPLRVSSTQRAEIIAKFETAGYTTARATAFADSFVNPAVLEFGVHRGSKALTIHRKADEHEATSAEVPHEDHNWVMYEAWELSHLFDLSVVITDEGAKSIIDHQAIRKGNWELVNPVTIPGGSGTYANVWGTYGYSAALTESTGMAWFASNCADYVYCVVPVGLIKDPVGSTLWQAQIILRRPRTIHDRNVALAYVRPTNAARTEMLISSLIYGYNRNTLNDIFTARGWTTHSFADGAGTNIETFQSAVFPAPVFSDIATEVKTDWPNIFHEKTKAIENGGDNLISKRLYVYGWLDAPCSCTWLYDNFNTTAVGDVSVITLNAAETVQSYSDAQLRRFIDQIIDHGDVSVDDVAKLTVARDDLTTSEDATMYVLSCAGQYPLSQTIDTSLPLAIKAEDNGVSLSEVVLSNTPLVTVATVADKARALKKLPALCFMPKGDQESGLFGSEVITFVGTGAPGSRVYSWSMTQLGVAYAASEEEMMVATKLGAQWILSTCTEAEVAGNYFGGAINRAEANAWIDNLDSDLYHDRGYRIDDYQCYTGLVRWPTSDGAQLATLSVNQLVGDRSNTAKMLLALSSWSVGRRLRHTYVTYSEYLAGETANNVATPVFQPKLGWNTDYLWGAIFSNYGNDVRAVLGGRSVNGFPPGSALKVCFSLQVINTTSSEIIGVTQNSDFNAITPEIRSWSAGLTNGTVVTLAYDRTTPGSNNLRMYRNGVYETQWPIADGAIVRPAVQPGSAGMVYRIDTDPEFKPPGYSAWNTDA